jgi:uncharacterized protein YndB with AHSA1/START domain
MCKTIKQRVKFKGSPREIYDLLVDGKKHKIGGKFKAGDATGINVDLAPGKRIVRAWRSSKFPEGIFSMAAFELKSTKDGGTELVLTHRGVPKNLIPEIEQRWRKHYWNKIKDDLADGKT